MTPQPITAEELRRILNYDPETGIFTWRAKISDKVVIGRIAGVVATNGHRYITAFKKHMLASRLACLYMTGKWPAQQIDHKNRVASDDRWDNLREATHSENIWNREKAKPNRFGIKGVRQDKRYPGCGYYATIRVNGKTHWLGTYKTKDEAAAAYQTAVTQYHGEFAYTGGGK